MDPALRLRAQGWLVVKAAHILPSLRSAGRRSAAVDTWRGLTAGAFAASRHTPAAGRRCGARPASGPKGASNNP